MISVTLHPEAEAELRGALDYHEGKQTGLGGDFLREVEAALQRVSENPQAYAHEGDQGVRYCPLHRFPYTLVYLEKKEHIWVVAVAHQRRRPRYWINRQPD